jgi:hypothetical protein
MKPHENKWYLDLTLDERIRANKMITDLIKNAYMPSGLAIESVKNYFATKVNKAK